jgi:putative copper resistance protein D
MAFFAVIRWLHDASLMALFGNAVLSWLLRRRLPTLAMPRENWRLAAAAVALLSLIFWLGCSTAQMAGNAGAAVDPEVLKLALTQTLFGQVFLARVALVVLLCAGIFLRWREEMVAFLAGAALVLISVTSHAAEASPAHFTAIGIASDGLHLLTGGYWIGGLILLAALFARGIAISALAGATAIFAEWGMVAVAVLVLTGMLNAANVLLGGEGQDAPLYLMVLGAKLALVLAMVTLAVINHIRLLPKLEQNSARLFRHIKWEIGLGLAVVMLAALLGLLPPTLGS